MVSRVARSGAVRRGQASVRRRAVRPIGIKLSLLGGALRMLLAGRGTELKAKLTQKGGKYLPTASVMYRDEAEAGRHGQPK